MPTLGNLKHEAFARNLVEMTKSGGTQGNAYSKAGYRCQNGAAEAAASRMLADVKNGIAERVRELMAGGAARAEITVASVLEKLDRVYDGATSARQYSAAGRAAEAQARIAGVGAADRIEVGGPGGFSEPSITETLALVGREFGGTLASTLAWALDHDDAEVPIGEIARITLANMSLDQALDRLNQLREALLEAARGGAVLVEAVPQDDPPRDTVDREALALVMQPKRRAAKR